MNSPSSQGIFAPTNKRPRTFVYEHPRTTHGAITQRALGRRNLDRVAKAFADNETFSTTQVADLLNMTVQTVRKHLRSIEKGLTQ